MFLPRKPLYLQLVGIGHIRRQEQKGCQAGSDQWGLADAAGTQCDVDAVTTTGCLSMPQEKLL